MKGIGKGANSLFEIFDAVCQRVPDYLSWICGENSQALFALLLVIGAFLSIIGFIISLKVTRLLWQIIKYPFVQVTREAFAKPELKGWLAKLPYSVQVPLFWFLCVLSAVTSLFAFTYSYIGWYPIFAASFESMKYGIFSYFILVTYAAFFVFYGALCIGAAWQYYLLVQLAKKQLNTALNRTRQKRCAG